MNERIRELVKQHGVDITIDGMGYGEGNIEGLVELIVLECYEHCKGQVLDKEVADTNELTYNDAVGDCANGLLQHFGIEE